MSRLVFEINSILIDKDHVNVCQTYYQPEELAEFEKNKHKVNPIYLEKDIEYKFNSLGYRTKNVTDLDNEFVLIFGCSHTEGIGHFNNDIWCNQLCDRINIDRLNLGKAGTGPDIQYYNTVQYIKNKYPLPRLVIYQWPQTFRKSFSYVQDKELILKHHNVNNETEKQDTDWFLKRYCEEPGEMLINNYFFFTACNELWKSINIPVYNWSWSGDFEMQYDSSLHLIETVDTGRARDMMHDGPDIHSQVVDQIIEDIDKLL